MVRESKEIEKQKEKIAKLDQWLESINNELNESTKHYDVIVEEDIIKYIEIYERYIRDYEEYEILLKSITVTYQNESNQSLRKKLEAMQNALQETKNLVIVEIERLRQVLIQVRSAPEVADDDISQTDRTIDSTSMPEEIVTPREAIAENKTPEKVTTPEEISDKVPTVQESKPSQVVKAQAVTIETQTGKSLASEPEVKKKPSVDATKMPETAVIETQTGQSLMSDPPSVSDKSVICQPEIIKTQDVAVIAAAPQHVEIQTSEPHLEDRELLENIQVRQFVTDGHETIEIASRPIYREQKIDDKSILVDANYKDDYTGKDSQLNITHSLPQSFETVMVEPDETTTEVVVDADGTKRIIVKKIRKTLVTRQQTVQTQQQRSQILPSDGVPQEQSFSQITLKEDKGSTSTTLDDGGIQHIQYQTYGGQVLSGLPGGEVTIQEFTSKPDMVIKIEQGMKPEDILQIAEGEVPQIQTSSSSVTAVVQQVTKRIICTRRRIIRRVVIIDGKEHVTEEIVEEPDVEVHEEQIPRVSISVKDQGGVVFEEIDDSQDKGDQPPPSLPPDKKGDTTIDYKPPENIPKTSPPKETPRESPKGSKPQSQHTEGDKPDLHELIQDFIQQEGVHGDFPKTDTSVTVIHTSQERETTPLQNLTLSETYQTLPSKGQQVYQVQKPQDNQYNITSEGILHSTLESSSANIATVVSKVTRKVTRTRKRIIKHIKIIDGKEYVTEEVIEEPDDVHIIEEEPQVSQHTIQEQNIKTKRIRIIRQVQIIDGKEHVTEQVIEEPDDEYAPETTGTDIDVPLGGPEISEVSQEFTSVFKEPVEKTLIQQTVLQTIKPTPSPKDEIGEIKDLPTLSLDTKNVLKSTTVEIVDRPTPATEEIVFAPEEQQTNTTIIDITNKLIGSEIDHSAASLEAPLPKTSVTEQNVPETEELLPKGPETKEPVPNKRKDKKHKKNKSTDEKSDSISASDIVSVPVHEIVQTVTEKEAIEDSVKPETVIMKESAVETPDQFTSITTKETSSPALQILTKTITQDEPSTKVTVTRNRKRIIKHIQIINDKEHINEEVIEEPEEVELLIGEPKLVQTLQEGGIETRRIRIVRHVHLIDGKEHVIDQVVEDADGEYIPDSTIIAEIDAHISKIHEIKPEEQIETSIVPAVKPQTVDATLALIGNEMENIAATQPTIQEPVAKKRDKKSKKGKKDAKEDVKPIKEKSPELPDTPMRPEIATVITEQTTVTEPVDTKTSTQDEVSQVTETITTTTKTTSPTVDVENNTTITDIITNFIGSETNHSAALKAAPQQPVPTKRDKKRKKQSEPVKAVVHEELKKEAEQEPRQIVEKLESRSPRKEVIEVPVESSTSEEFVSPTEQTTPTDIVITAKISPITEIVETKTVKEKSPEYVKDKTPSPDKAIKQRVDTEIISKGITKTPEVKEINILELTKQLLEKENIHAADIHSPVKIKETVDFIQTTIEEPMADAPKHIESAPKATHEQLSTVTTVTPGKKHESLEVDKIDSPTYIEQLSKPEVSQTVEENINIVPLIHGVESMTEIAVSATLPEQVTTKAIVTVPQKNIVKETQELLKQEFVKDQVLLQPEQHLITESSQVTREETAVPLKQHIVPEKSQIIPDKPPKLYSVDVEPLQRETVVTESITTVVSEVPQISYIQQFKTPLQSSTESIDKLVSALEKEPQPENPIMPSVTLETVSPIKSGTYDINLLLDSERQDTQLRGLQQPVNESKPIQTVDISVSISKTDEAYNDEPKVQFDLKVGGLESNEPFIVKKDVDVLLPSDLKIITESIPQPVPQPLEKEQQAAEVTPEESIIDRKRSKKRKKHKVPEAGDSIGTETDKSTESSSLSHYVELPTSPPIESPKPTGDVLEPVLQELEPDSLVTESDYATEEKGYEPEDASLGAVPTPDKKKRQKKRKAYAVTEETTYPKLTTAESDDTTISTPVEIADPALQKKSRSKKGKKKLPQESVTTPDIEPKPEPEIQPESPNIGEIGETSPKDESYHTMSETSDISTVKIVEECIQSSPESVKKEVPTTITYTVPVVEEILTQEYSVQTSPEVVEETAMVDIPDIPRPETAEAALQTSPKPIRESLVQTTPVEEQEAHTQTLEEVIVVEKIEKSDSQMQTSKSASPEPIIRTEMTTQVVPLDIYTPEEKFSQTSSIEELEVPPVIVTESREIQTSPLPEVQKQEKSTEVIIETTETDIQTVKQEIADQETSTSPVKKNERTEISIQTYEVPLVSAYTQSEAPNTMTVPVTEERIDFEKPSLPELEITKTDVITVDSTQQTSPIPKEIVPVLQPEVVKEVVTVDSTQQTSPTPEEAISMPPIDPVISEIITVDGAQQTSPRDESISTSTDEPYEVHLRAQISIPEATTEFIESERQPPQSILTEKQKHKKWKSKKKADSPVQSPESLSDLITRELSLSGTPTSDDQSCGDFSSIDEGISQLASPTSPRQENYVAEQHKLTYSDVVQRSKSKSPSPSKTVFPQKSKKARLLEALEKRTQSVTESQKGAADEFMAVALQESSVDKSYELVINKELDEVRNATKNNDPRRIDKSVTVIIETISIWLEEIQYKIQRETASGSKSIEESERLKALKSYIQHLNEIIEVTEVSEEIITLIETLTRQVDAVNILNNQSSVKVKEIEKEWAVFLEDTEKLSRSVDKVKSTVDDTILSDIPTQQKLDKLDNIESENIDNLDEVNKLFRRFRALVEVNPKLECPTSLYSCEDDTKQVENVINTERDRLLQLTSLAEEYEQTLQDFGQITDVAEALLDGKIIVSNLDHLHEEIQKHRKFFVNLSHCRAILESLEDNLDSETRAKYSSFHNSLHDRATVIIDRAASRAQQMTLAASRWTMLDHGMKEECQWLRVAQQRLPDLTNVTSMDHEQYINLYQSISMDVSHHHAKILRLLSITEGLQGLIVCSGLETTCSTALDVLLKLQEDVDSRLTRLTAFRENWLTYDHLIDRIEGWMKTANRELEHITPENITTTGNLRRFWELKAQHEVHNNLKNESGVQFEKALEILPISDEMVQRQFFSKIEDMWRDLAARIDNIHASAIQNISDRDVSSGEKLNILEEELRELRAILDSLKGVIKSEDELNLYIERLQVMTSRIDRIQNELGRLSLLPTAESERMGALLTQSGTLDDQIAEELERSLLLKEKILQVQAGIVKCQKSQRRARLTIEECEAAERLGSDVVEKASESCEKLLEDLAAQWRDILALRQALHTLPISLRVCVSPIGVERDITALQVKIL